MTTQEIHQNKVEAIIQSKQNQLNHTPCNELMENKFVDFDGKIKYASELYFNSIDFWRKQKLRVGYELEA